MTPEDRKLYNHNDYIKNKVNKHKYYVKNKETTKKRKEKKKEEEKKLLSEAQEFSRKYMNWCKENDIKILTDELVFYPPEKKVVTKKTKAERIAWKKIHLQ